jgi:tRNA threonylcarbamoyladenosine biosynthesis protein TsaE
MSTELIWQTTSTGSDDTLRLGEALGSRLKSPLVIELRSDLGGGKTTLTQGLAQGLGSKDVVSSPTFTLSKIYKCAGGVEVHHFDFYRLSEAGVLRDQLDESLKDEKVITIIEWSDIVADVLPPEHLSIELKLKSDNPDERQINISYPESLVGVIRAVESAYQESRP